MSRCAGNEVTNRHQKCRCAGKNVTFRHQLCHFISSNDINRHQSRHFFGNYALQPAVKNAFCLPGNLVVFTFCFAFAADRNCRFLPVYCNQICGVFKGFATPYGGYFFTSISCIKKIQKLGYQLRFPRFLLVDTFVTKNVK